MGHAHKCSVLIGAHQLIISYEKSNCISSPNTAWGIISSSCGSDSPPLYPPLPLLHYLLFLIPQPFQGGRFELFRSWFNDQMSQGRGGVVDAELATICGAGADAAAGADLTAGAFGGALSEDRAKARRKGHVARPKPRGAYESGFERSAEASPVQQAGAGQGQGGGGDENASEEGGGEALQPSTKKPRWQ